MNLVDLSHNSRFLPQVLTVIQRTNIVKNIETEQTDVIMRLHVIDVIHEIWPRNSPALLIIVSAFCEGLSYAPTRPLTRAIDKTANAIRRRTRLLHLSRSSNNLAFVMSVPNDSIGRRFGPIRRARLLRANSISHFSQVFYARKPVRALL